MLSFSVQSAAAYALRVYYTCTDKLRFCSWSCQSACRAPQLNNSQAARGNGMHGWPMRFGSIRFFDSTRAEAIRPIRFDQLARLRGHNDGSLQKQRAPRCVFPAPKMHLDERLIFKAAPRRSMLPDAFSRLRKMHLDKRLIFKAAPRRSMLLDAFSRLRKMHLDEWWILKAAPRRSTLPDAFFPAPKNASGQAVDFQGSF